MKKTIIKFIFKLVGLICLFLLSDYSRLYSQNLVFKSIKYNSDSIIDVIREDSSKADLVFSRYLGIVKSEDRQYRQKFKQGIITADSKMIFLDNNDEYIGSIDNYIYTANYYDKNTRTVKCYKLEKGELLLTNNFVLDEAVGYFQISEINKVLVYFNSSEGFGANIILLNKDLKKIFEYRPFTGLYTDISLNGMYLHKLIFSFRSGDNPHEYKVLSYNLAYNLADNQVLPEFKFENIVDYLDRIISYEDGNILFGCYDINGYYLIKINISSKQIINKTTFDFGTTIFNIRKDEVILHSSNDIISYNTKSYSENWRLKLTEDINENIAISSFNILPQNTSSEISGNYCVVLSRFDGATKTLIDNSLYIINKTGHVIESQILPKQLQNNILGLLVFASYTGIKIYAGNKEIELIVK
ncbi:MAG: hypothetical protein WCI92_13035 [Bacteroidota bacterium]